MRRAKNEGSIRQRSDGRWEARATGGIDYRTGKPKRISVYGKTKSEVIGKLRELEYDIHNRKAIDPTSTKFVDWLTYWLETYKKNNIKQSTYVSYRGYIDRHVAAGFPVMKLKDLTSRDLQEFYNYKLTVENLSAKTILNIHRCLHEALKQAVLEHYLTFNPSDAVVLPKREKPEIEILTREEQAKLIQASYQFRYGIFIRLTLTTGMRLGEVLGLKWENIDLRSGILNIRAYQNMGMVVTNPLGGYIEPRTFKDYYNKILQSANIGHYTFHALRHTFCTRALENDMDAKTVSTIMGHYSVAFTLDVYGHVLDSHKREEMMKMEGLFDLPTIPPQQQSYPVIVTPNANGFILNVVDFDDLSFEVDNIQFGLTCIKDAITEKLVGYCPPVPTPCSDLVLSAGEFVLIVNI